jgi:hypothetical protein
MLIRQTFGGMPGASNGTPYLMSIRVTAKFVDAAQRLARLVSRLMPTGIEVVPVGQPASTILEQGNAAEFLFPAPR